MAASGSGLLWLRGAASGQGTLGPPGGLNEPVWPGSRLLARSIGVQRASEHPVTLAPWQGIVQDAHRHCPGKASALGNLPRSESQQQRPPHLPS